MVSMQSYLTPSGELELPPQPELRTARDLLEELSSFEEFGAPTICESLVAGELEVPVFINEFWTSKQRAAHRIHEVSYRACFKPQLPEFFISRLTREGDVVYDPFSGRGTTAIQAALMGRTPWACDINPLSRALARPRLNPPTLSQVKERLAEIPWDRACGIWEELLVFYHPATLGQLTNLRDYFIEKEAAGTLDDVDEWIRMVAVNRLTGHSTGFFSVYSLPPNQAVSIDSQCKINERRNQEPPLRDVPAIITKKSKSLLGTLTNLERSTLRRAAEKARLVTGDSRNVAELDSGEVQLLVTSPPFLDIVNYKADNWLRCWFLGIDPEDVEILQLRKLEDWAAAMTAGFREHHRLLRPGAWIAFEVGEVRNGTVKLEETVVACGMEAGFVPRAIMINAQEFTKTANCWGVDNQTKGTNTNRIVLFQKG